MTPGEKLLLDDAEEEIRQAQDAQGGGTKGIPRHPVIESTETVLEAGVFGFEFAGQPQSTAAPGLGSLPPPTECDPCPHCDILVTGTITYDCQDGDTCGDTCDIDGVIGYVGGDCTYAGEIDVCPGPNSLSLGLAFVDPNWYIDAFFSVSCSPSGDCTFFIDSLDPQLLTSDCGPDGTYNVSIPLTAGSGGTCTIDITLTTDCP